MKHLQIKPHNQFNIALQPRASIKKANSYNITCTRQPGICIGQVQQAVCAMQTAQRTNTKTLGSLESFDEMDIPVTYFIFS